MSCTCSVKRRTQRWRSCVVLTVLSACFVTVESCQRSSRIHATTRTTRTCEDAAHRARGGSAPGRRASLPPRRIRTWNSHLRACVPFQRRWPPRCGARRPQSCVGRAVSLGAGDACVFGGSPCPSQPLSGALSHPRRRRRRASPVILLKARGQCASPAQRLSARAPRRHPVRGISNTQLPLRRTSSRGRG